MIKRRFMTKVTIVEAAEVRKSIKERLITKLLSSTLYSIKGLKKVEEALDNAKL